MIKLENVTKTYNKTVRAVDDISFEVKGGEIVGFIGPNGSGKTTNQGEGIHRLYCRQSGYVPAAEGHGIS